MLSTLAAAQAPAQYGFVPIYWVIGQVNDSADNKARASDCRLLFHDKNKAAGRQAVLFEKLSGQAFMINAWDRTTIMLPSPSSSPPAPADAADIALEANKTYSLGVSLDKPGDSLYRAEGRVTISGYGFDEVEPNPLTLTTEAGRVQQYNNGILAGTVECGGIPVDGVTISVNGTNLTAVTDGKGNFVIMNVIPGNYKVDAAKKYYAPFSAPAVQIKRGELTLLSIKLDKIKETPPRVTSVKFGSRVYQKQLVQNKNYKFVVGSSPRIEVQIDEQDGFGINAGSFSITRDRGQTGSYNYDVSAARISSQAAAGGSVSNMSLIFDIPSDKPLNSGQAEEETHTLSFMVSSAGLKATTAVTEEVVTLTVMGGPLRLIGDPLAYPSPFSIRKNGTVTIQYTLSQDADIEVYIIDSVGSRIKKFACDAGAEGGMAGLNKLTWDGKTFSGGLAGNAIYVGTIVGRKEGKLLGKFKLTILD